MSLRDEYPDIAPEDFPFRDAVGNAVTLTDDQHRAIWHAVQLWLRTYQREKGERPDLNNTANLSKSCLLGRLLLDGRPALPKPPPVVNSAPAYWLVDPLLCPNCTCERSGPPGVLGTSIEAPDESFVELYRGARKQAPGKIVTRYMCGESWHHRGAA